MLESNSLGSFEKNQLPNSSSSKNRQTDELWKTRKVERGKRREEKSSSIDPRWQNGEVRVIELNRKWSGFTMQDEIEKRIIEDDYSIKLKSSLERRKLWQEFIHMEREHIMNLMAVNTGPPWFQDLSFRQMNLFENLMEIVRTDYEEGIVSRTQRTLLLIGIYPLPPAKMIWSCMKRCRDNVIIFVFLLHKVIVKIEAPEYEKSYQEARASGKTISSFSINERILLSGVFHIHFPVFTKKLNKILPLPKKAPRIILPTQKKPVKVKYDSPYLEPVPLTDKVWYEQRAEDEWFAEQRRRIEREKQERLRYCMKKFVERNKKIREEKLKLLVQEQIARDKEARERNKPKPKPPPFDPVEFFIHNKYNYLLEGDTAVCYKIPDYKPENIVVPNLNRIEDIFKSAKAHTTVQDKKFDAIQDKSTSKLKGDKKLSKKRQRSESKGGSKGESRKKTRGDKTKMKDSEKSLDDQSTTSAEAVSTLQEDSGTSENVSSVSDRTYSSSQMDDDGYIGQTVYHSMMLTAEIKLHHRTSQTKSYVGGFFIDDFTNIALTEGIDMKIYEEEMVKGPQEDPKTCLILLRPKGPIDCRSEGCQTIDIPNYLPLAVAKLQWLKNDRCSKHKQNSACAMELKPPICRSSDSPGNWKSPGTTPTDFGAKHDMTEEAVQVEEGIAFKDREKGESKTLSSSSTSAADKNKDSVQPHHQSLGGNVPSPFDVTKCTRSKKPFNVECSSSTCHLVDAADIPMNEGALIRAQISLLPLDQQLSTAVKELQQRGDALAILPDIEKTPWLIRWFEKRNLIKWPMQEVDKEDLLEKSTRMWESPYTKVFTIPLPTIDFGNRPLTFDDKPRVDIQAKKIVGNYHSQVRKQLVDNARDLFPSMYCEYFTSPLNKNLREIFFTYFPSRELDTYVYRPGNAAEGHKFLGDKNDD